MVMDVKPRRTVGISGYDVGRVTLGKGMGQCVGGYDEYGAACTDFTPITSDPTATAAAINYLYTPPNAAPNVFGGPSAAPSSGINWNQLFAPLTQAAGAIGAGYAASQLKPGQSVAAPGYMITGQGTALPGSGFLGMPGVTASSAMPILLLVGGGLLLVMMMGRR